jgi:hypothetical protein
MYDTVKTYINSFELEEGGPLSFVEGGALGKTIYWGSWYGRKLLYIAWSDMGNIAEVAFSLDFAQHEVAQFCKDLEHAIGEWRAVDGTFIAVGDVADGSEKILWGTKALLYRTFRDAGRIGDDDKSLQ